MGESPRFVRYRTSTTTYPHDRRLEGPFGGDVPRFCVAVEAGNESDSFAVSYDGNCPEPLSSTQSAEPEPAGPLTAEFVDAPPTHDGAGDIAFELRFNQALADGFSDATLQGSDTVESAIGVTGGTLAGVERIVAGDTRRWRVTVSPASADEDVFIALAPTFDCAAANAICSASGEPLSVGLALAVPAAPATSEATDAPELTVAYTAAPPAEHDGESAFTFAFGFSENLHADYSYKTMRDRSLSVVQGGARLTPHVKRKTPGGGNNQDWVVTVTPTGYGDIAIALGPSADCADAGAMCTGEGVALSNALPATSVQGPPGLSVADAETDEGAGATVEFAVTLSRAASGAVTVDYATSDGTATAGSDYTGTSGTLTFAVGETQKTVSVPVLDDGVDEGEETFTLTLSNADGGNAYLADATATGTIANDDPMPQAWLARFGRTLAGQAVDMVAARLEGGGGAQVTVGGQRLDLSGGAAAPAEADEVRGVFESLGFDEDAPAVSTRTMTGRELLLGSSFNLSAGGEGDGPAWAAWGRVATGGFDAAEDGVRMSGSVTSAFLGADVARGRWLAGLALSMSEGEGDYTHEETGAGGDVESTLTALYPYARLSVNERLDVWGLAGWGTGELTLTHGHRTMRRRRRTARTSRCAWARWARGASCCPRASRTVSRSR